MIRHPIRALFDGLAHGAGRPALHEGPVTLSHGQLIERVEAMAGALAALGAGRGDRIGLCAANSWRHAVVYLAILRLGAVWTPLNPRNGATLNRELRRRAGLTLTLYDAASTDALGDTAGAILIDDVEASTTRATLPEIDDAPDAPFALKFTGGSTGAPKGVVQSVRSAATALASLEAFYGFSTEDVNLAVAPLTHGAAHYILPVLAAGGSHVLLDRPDRAAILAELKRRVSVVFMPPTLIYLLMQEAAFSPDDFPALRHLTWSAAPMPPARIAEAIGRFGPVLSSLYGQTEAPMTIAGLSPEELADPASRTSVGRPFPGTPVAVLDSDGEVRTANAEGEVLVGGDLAATWYLDDPELTTATRHDAWRRTGDIGRLDPEGYLHLLGRTSELIITGGYNVYPAEVEAALSRHPAVREACAFGVEDPVWGDRLEAAVATTRKTDATELTAFVREAIGPVRTPKTIHLLAALPRNPVGKVVRSEVRDMIYPATERSGDRQKTEDADDSRARSADTRLQGEGLVG
jgi:acyl-CoA synthetase (AMP-forming)/AMP-acid ligase II